MKAASKPPDPQVIAEASVLVDPLILWRDGDRELAHTSTDGSEPEIIAVNRVVNAAVAEYLRQNPRARSPSGQPHYWTKSEFWSLENLEWDVCCVFCRASLNTTVRGGNAPRAFWLRIEKHCYVCAALFLAGMVKPTKPKKGERVRPVNKLKGKALLKAAIQAAEYLGVTKPRGGRYGVRTQASVMRVIVADARRVASARQKGTPDAEIPSLRQAQRIGYLNLPPLPEEPCTSPS